MMGTPRTRPAACVHCRRPMCGKRHPRTPGIVPYSGKGRCEACAARIRRGQDVEQSAPLSVYAPRTENPRILELRHENTVNGHDRYIAGRRARGIPPEGLPPEHWGRKAS